MGDKTDTPLSTAETKTDCLRKGREATVYWTLLLSCQVNVVPHGEVFPDPLVPPGERTQGGQAALTNTVGSTEVHSDWGDWGEDEGICLI